MGDKAVPPSSTVWVHETDGGAFKKGHHRSGITKYQDPGESERERILEGQARFRRLGWKRLMIISVVEAIALSSLTLPSALVTLGTVSGVILPISIALTAIHAGYNIRQVKVEHPEVDYLQMLASFYWKTLEGVFLWALLSPY